MQTIHKQILTDENGKPISVLIPYREWLAIEQQLGTLKDTANAAHLQRYAGTVQIQQDPLAYQKQIRGEWT